MAGTRASHPVTADALDLLNQRGFRAAFLIGNREHPDRYQGINYARSRLEAAGVEHRYEEYPGGHVMPHAEVFQDTILYVSAVSTLPEVGSPSFVHRGGAPGFLSHTSRDRFAVRVAFPAQISPDGIIFPNENEVTLRAEWPWSRHYLRTTAKYSAGNRSTDERERRVHQDLLLGIGESRGFFGAGIGWDWIRQFSDGNSYGELDLLLMRADRNPWIVPPGSADPDRVDSLLLLRYTIPRGLSDGVTAEQLLNLRAEYLLRIADRVVFDAGLGAYTVQNRPVDSLSALSEALDHRLEGQIGIGVRAPSPLLWRIGYRGTAERPLPDGSFDYRGIWNLSLEYSY